MIDLSEKQRQRKVLDRKALLINELIRLGADIDQDRPLSGFNLVELEQLHINEKCRSSCVFTYLNS